MTFRSAASAFGFMILIGSGLLGASAQDVTAPDGQQPPAEQKAADEKPPEKPKCVSSNTAFKEKGNAATFEIELENACDARLRCTVDAFVIGSRGQAQGHGTLILAAAPKGQTTRNVYVMKIKSTGGMANVSHRCKPA